nr:SRPBCC family protein [Sphingomonas deserti]
MVGRTVTINRSAQELYDFWRNFENLTQFMDNVRSVETLDGGRSHWTIAGPAGTEVKFVSRITEDQPGRVIAWESEEGADVRNTGRIEFIDAAPGRGTMVRATITYDPPAGAIGRAVAKVLQREPNVQARRDLRRFKQLMETGEVTSSASPSGRRSEDPTKQYL